jgi:hypothetical protein
MYISCSGTTELVLYPPLIHRQRPTYVYVYNVVGGGGGGILISVHIKLIP